MNSVEIEVEAVCEKCGRALEGSADMVRSNFGGKIVVTVTPCQNCLDEAYSQGEEAEK